MKRRKRLTEIEVQCYLIQIIKALKYIHSHKIIHRDLKLGNCFITNKLELKLGDFGLAAKLEYEGQRRRTVCGTPNYIAPEILEKKNGHSFEVDIWSLGVVAYTLLFGRPPFETSDVKLTYKKIKMNNYTFPENIKVHPSAKRLISSILNLDPSKRLSLDAILEHEFFRIYNSVPVRLTFKHFSMSTFSKNILCNLQKVKVIFSCNMEVLLISIILSPTSNLWENSVQTRMGKNEFELNALNNNINMNSAENINLNNNISKDIITRLLHQANESPFHRKSESMNNLIENKINDGNFLEKVNIILQNVNNTNMNNSNGSRNLANKNEINFIKTEKINPNSNTKFTKEEIIVNENQNIINNNYFINVGNLNNMELKLDESIIKKLEEGPVGNKNIKNLIQNQNLINNVLIPNSNSTKLAFSNKITKFYDYTNKFGIVYFVNNTHLSICFNDYSNILKKVSPSSKSTIEENNLNGPNLNNLLHHKNFEYIYLEKDGKNTLNFDENGFDEYIKNTKRNSKDIIKKFEIFKHILDKYTNEIISLGGNNITNNIKIFYVKKFLKVQHAMMFRLSNKLIQVSFSDKTELIMSTETSDFYYKSKNGEELMDSIQNVMTSDNTEMIKRIKYAKNLLIHFVKNQKSKKIPK